MRQPAEWVRTAFDDSDFGDHRRRGRVLRTVTTLAQNSEASVGEVAEDWAETLAIYRLLSNQSINHTELVRSIGAATGSRCRGESPLVVVQDTTAIIPSAPRRCQDRGAVGTADELGFLQHSSLVLNEAGTPLGIGHQQVWSREPTVQGRRHRRAATPIEGKESRVWLESAHQTWRHLPAGVPVITVADRAADIFELYALHEQQQTDFVVRLAQNRLTEDGKLWDVLAQAPVRGEQTVTVPRADDRASRSATVTLRSCPVRLLPTERRPVTRAAIDRWHQLHADVAPLLARPLGPLALNVIDIREEDPPDGYPPLHWRLATSLPGDSLADAGRCMQLYRLRWQVERFHYVLKHGCRIEARQLERLERLMRASILYSLIAWRQLWLTHHARHQPHACCETVVPPVVWQVVVAMAERRAPRPDDRPPDLATFLALLGRLGGHLGRTNDGPPGVKTTWRGLRRVHDLAEFWQLVADDRPPVRSHSV